MTLATRLLFAFGFVALMAATALGLSMRSAARQVIEEDFADRIDAASHGVEQELASEVLALRELLGPLCAHDTFVDRANLLLDRAGGDVSRIDSGARIAMRYQVPDQARALGLDELTLATADGTILGAVDVARVGAKDPRIAALLRESKDGPPRLRSGIAGELPSIEVHCTRSGGAATVGLLGARRIEPILERIGRAYGVGLVPLEGGAAAPASTNEVTVRELRFMQPAGLRVAASVPRARLVDALERIDRAVLVAGAGTLFAALLMAVLLARSLSRPIVALAQQAREVVAGDPRPVRAAGGGRELLDLATSFNRALDEVAAMRKRLAVTERIAARREVARKVAHEIKNPLAPIRAAVETLRRLRARDDPAFDDYFDEATRTVLEEVFRISNIVTEFTNFSRLPPPSPEHLDLVAVAQRVVALHATSPEATSPTKSPRVELSVEPIREVFADKDQMVQVLTNLVQNGLDAASAVRPDPRVVVTIGPVDEARVRIVVRDNGPGVSKEMLPRLFEPYATTKQKGTGLGLAIAQRIVFEHGGELSYREATKGGAVFEIVLPVAGPPLLEKPPSVEITANPTRDAKASPSE